MTNLQQMIDDAHDPKLAEQAGSVYQLWQDGEITLTKSGALLNQRTLHQMMPPLHFYRNDFEMPAVLGKNSFIYCTRSDAYELRDIIEA